ncbi:MAG: Flp pilus assembly protein CpaB [Myxococcales bacterium]|nr:Flp pilus assembly protein CpaB [Myxococcales bacterium]
MNKRALTVAMIAGACGFLLLWVYKQRYEQTVCGGTKQSVVVAVRDLPLGTTITEDMLGLREVPGQFIEERHIRAPEATRIVGVKMTTAVRANEAILWTDLAVVSEQRRDLSSLINDGRRAVAVRADVTSTFGGLLRPGDRVDVILTYQRQDGRQASRTLMQNRLVLAAGTDTGSSNVANVSEGQARGSGYAEQIVLSVNVDEAQALAFAQERGSIRLVLRNPNDITLVKGIPETGEESLRGREVVEPEAPKP